MRFSPLFLAVLSFSTLLILQGCGNDSAGSGGSSTEDTSASGAVAGAVGGSAGTGGGNTTLGFLEPKVKHQYAWTNFLSQFIPSAEATLQCPSIQGNAALGCAASGSGVLLTYFGCHFGSSAASWTGTQLATGTPAINCAESLSSYTGSLNLSTGATLATANGLARTAATGTVVIMDTSGTIAAMDTNHYSGGVQVTLASGVPNQIAISGLNLYGDYANGSLAFSHSLSTTTPISLSGGTITGGVVKTIHNRVKVVATSTFSNVSFSAGCCTPTQGTINTTFASIPGVTGQAGNAYVGKSESLQFTGCGTAIYTGPEGYSGNVNVSHCY